MQPALNGGEINICSGKIDGFNNETNTVYQYHGCFWRGRPKCYNEDTINKVNHDTMGDLHQKTIERSKYIIDDGFTLIEMWEYQWFKSKEYKNIVKNSNDIVEPLNPARCLLWWPKNASKLEVLNKILRYIDVCSLYPTVQYFDYYPLCHPEKIYNPEKNDKYWYGLIKCKMVAPKKLYNPVLPIKKDKLKFTLCTKCFDEKCNSCTHNDEERELLRTWTTDEVHKALEKGYSIMQNYEVWHFKKKEQPLQEIRQRFYENQIRNKSLGKLFQNNSRIEHRFRSRKCCTKPR